MDTGNLTLWASSSFVCPVVIDTTVAGTATLDLWAISSFTTPLVVSMDTALYTRGEAAALPGDDSDMATAYSAQDYLDVEIDDATRVEQTAQDEYFAIHLFKNYIGTATSCSLICNLQSSVAPSDSPVYLQIYNYNLAEWETVDSDSAALADTDFTLEASVPDTADYLSSGVVCCRVYQLASVV